MSWETIKLGDCCEITSSKRIFYSEYTDHGVPFYRSKKKLLNVAKANLSVNPYISQIKYDGNKKIKFGVPVAGDMLLTSVGTIGIPYIVKEADEFYFKDGNLTGLGFTNKLCAQYLYYWVTSKDRTGVLNNTTIGSSKTLTISALKNIEITVPPIENQRRIADILFAYDDLIENNQSRSNCWKKRLSIKSGL